MPDKVEKLGNSYIQHGTFNDRIYLMKLSCRDYPDIVNRLNNLAGYHRYSKIFVKVPESAGSLFRKNDYKVEARIPSFYDGEETGLFLGKFLQKNRQNSSDQEMIQSVLKTAEEKTALADSPTLPEPMRWRICRPDDSEEMAEAYRHIFETYPFPIHDPNYLRETMADNVVYFAVECDEKIVSLASSEICKEDCHVEMTDFATLPEYRRNRLATFLLSVMEEEMRRLGLKLSYTIARAISYGMNITFSSMGYQYSGTLLNNTNISGRLESMNVWYKFL
ncbi:MAG: Beta-lysine N6-acetyltransferase [Candidatus Argoarchaeum ethanivorans]|uniref:Beta-lysine N6-acetyltransferase n=1 Tax=Candidatus Argoarchaeum ethanivorans TaxID=2608793 RepID=A0A811T214_9EURY|nr:MAG: Beta-lysine N6-acetyltransferase [Candidatus Argoarchaeum ethanivorans]